MYSFNNTEDVIEKWSLSEDLDEVHDSNKEIDITSSVEIESCINKDIRLVNLLNCYDLLEDDLFLSDKNLNILCEHAYKLEKFLSSSNHPKKILQQAIIYLTNAYAKPAIRRYSKSEQLPLSNQILSGSQNCLELLLVDYFKEELEIEITNDLYKEIYELVKNLDHEKNLIAYEKTTRVQEFVHYKTNYYLGLGENNNLNKVKIKNLLSTARLFYLIKESRFSSSKSFAELEEEYLNKRNMEFLFPLPSINYKSKKNFPYWRIRHLTSIFYFYKKEIRDAIFELDSLYNSEFDSNLIDRKFTISLCLKYINQYNNAF